MDSGQDGNNVVGPGGVGVGSGAPISSGQGMMPNQLIMSGGGDIVLNNSGDQKSKKGLKWAIGIIVGVLILVGVGVGVWWGTRSNGVTIEDDMNRYANLLFMNEDSEKKFEGDISVNSIMASDVENIYNIARHGDPLSQENIAYCNRLKELLGNIVDKISKSNKYSIDDKEELGFYLTNSEILLSYYFSGTALAYTNASYEYYMQHGSLEGFLLEYGYPFEYLEDELMLTFKEGIDSLYGIKEGFYNAVSEMGCIIGGSIDYACVNSNASLGFIELQKYNTEFNEIVGNYMDSILYWLVDDLQNMKGMIGNYEEGL